MNMELNPGGTGRLLVVKNNGIGQQGYAMSTPLVGFVSTHDHHWQIRGF